MNESILHPNPIHNRRVAERPFEVVVSDTTQLHSLGRKYELNLHIEALENEIDGRDTARIASSYSQPDRLAVLRNVLACKKRRGYAQRETVLHTDQGTIDASHACALTLYDWHMTPSMSKPARRRTTRSSRRRSAGSRMNAGTNRQR